MQEPVVDLTALAHTTWLLGAVAAQCDKATLHALCLASRATCAAARRARSTNIIVPRERAAKLVVALAAGRLPAVRAIKADAGPIFPCWGIMGSLWSPPAALLAVLPRLPTLRALSMTRIALGPAGAVPAVTAQLAACTQLESLDIPLSEELGDAGARALAAALTRLTALNVWGCGLTADGAAAVAALPRLQRLDIRGNPLGDAGGVALSALTGLTYLCAWDVGCPQLLHHLRGLRRLEHLLVFSFWGHQGMPVDEERAAVEHARAHVTALTSMRRLRALSGPPLDDSAAAMLSGVLTALTGLTSYKAQGLTGPGLAALGRLPLVELRLVCAHAQGAAPTGLSPLAPTLRDLALEQASVDDGGAEAIARLTGLTSLSLAANRITRAGVASLAGGLAGLHTLDLTYNPAGAAAVEPLSALTALSRLGADFLYRRRSSAHRAAVRALRHFNHLVVLQMVLGQDWMFDDRQEELEHSLRMDSAFNYFRYDPPAGWDGGGANKLAGGARTARVGRRGVRR